MWHENFIQAVFMELRRNSVMRKLLNEQETFEMFETLEQRLDEQKATYATVDDKKVPVQYCSTFIRKRLLPMILTKREVDDLGYIPSGYIVRNER